MNKQDDNVYLFHPESDCLWISKKEIWLKRGNDMDSGLIVELTKEEYEKKRKELNQ